MDINTRDWGLISDHRPVLFTIKADLNLKELKRRIAKSLFFVPSAVKEAKSHYENGIEEQM